MMLQIFSSRIRKRWKVCSAFQ